MDSDNKTRFEELGGQMSFLEHLDEFRKRLVRSLLFIGIAFIFCWFVKDPIYNFLQVPVKRALNEAQRQAIPIDGKEEILSLTSLKEGEKGRYVFAVAGSWDKKVAIPIGTSVTVIVAKDTEDSLGLFSDEPMYVGNSVIPKGSLLKKVSADPSENETNSDEKLVFTTPLEPFQLYLLVALYGAIALSVPFLLFQVWGFISPALYKHERKYVTPFVLLSSISFVLGAAFAYYIVFPPALGYLLGLGENFTPFLKATDYFDFVTLIILAMGGIFQMPAIAYVLSRIGLISAGFLIKSWKIALIVILIVAAFVSPTGDVPNLMLFAAPMVALYMVSILIAWVFGRKRKSED